MVVYVDLAFAINFCIDAVLLVTTALLFSTRIRYWRIGAAAAIGSLYAVATLFPGYGALADTPGKLAIALLMTVVALATRGDWTKLAGWRRLSLRLVGFFVVSAASGGIIMAIQSVFSDSSTGLGQLAYVRHQVGWWTSLGTVAWSILLPLAAVVGMTLLRRSGRVLRVRQWYVNVRISMDDVADVELRALVDSGNILKDPIAHLPVAVVNIDAIAAMLPLYVYRTLCASADPYQAAHDIALNAPEFANRLRFIPYRGMGKKSGVLIGVPLARAELASAQKRETLPPMLVAFAKAEDFPEADFDCILPVANVFSKQGGMETDAKNAVSSDQAVHTTNSA